MQPSFTAVGKTIRLNRIFKEDGKAVMIAINHGLGMGPVKGIEEMSEILEKILPESPDSLTIHKGMALRFCDQFAGRVPLVLKATNITRFFGPDETPVATVDEAIKLGADAIAVGISLCDPLERESVQHASKIIAAAEKVGMPTVAHSYPNGEFITNDERYNLENVGYATRLALELGIDIIKTFWTGSQETFARIVELGSPAKVVISGGAKSNTLRECFDMTWQGIQAGAAGITYGRNVWQHEYPAAVMRGLTAIVHKGASVNEALEIAEDCAKVKLI
jgi:class I fructose-bisphosphate aldolase